MNSSMLTLNQRLGIGRRKDATGVFLFGARKGTEKGCICSRKSRNRSKKQSRRAPLPGSQLRWRAVRIAHSEKTLASQKMNEFIFWLASVFFLCPEALLAAFQFWAQIVCWCFQVSSPDEVQEMKSPGAEVWRPRRPPSFPLPFRLVILLFAEQGQVSIKTA